MLTGKQHHFARLIAAGELPQWACYAEAYDADNSLRRTMIEEASKVMADHNVTTTVERIRASLSGDAVVTLEGHVRELARIKALALEGEAEIRDGKTIKITKNFGAAARCEELRGKVAGHYVERVRNEGPEELSVADFCTVKGRVVEEAVRLVERAVQILEEVERGGLPHVVKEAS